MNIKVEIKNQLTNYREKESIVPQEKGVVEKTVIHELSEDYFKRIFSVDDSCRFTTRRNEYDMPVLAKIDKREKEKSKLSKFIDRWKNSLFVLGLFIIMVSSIGMGVTSNTYFALLYFSAIIFVAIGVSAIGHHENTHSDKGISYIIEELTISPEDWCLFENLGKNCQEYNFETLYELFAESYLDFKTSNSKQAKEVNLLVAEIMINTIQISIDLDEEKEYMNRNNIDSKRETVKKGLA